MLCFPTKLATTGWFWVNQQPCSSCGTISWATTTYTPIIRRGLGKRTQPKMVLEDCRFLCINQGRVKLFPHQECMNEQSMKEKQTSWDGWSGLLNDRGDCRLPRRPRQAEEKKVERHSTHTMSQKTPNDSCVLYPGHRTSKCKHHSSSQCWISKVFQPFVIIIPLLLVRAWELVIEQFIRAI